MTASLLARAREIAAQTGDGNRMGTAFGRVNVAMHAISASLQLGDAKAAIETGESLDPATLPAGLTGQTHPVEPGPGPRLCNAQAGRGGSEPAAGRRTA